MVKDCHQAAKLSLAGLHKVCCYACIQSRTACFIFIPHTHLYSLFEPSTCPKYQNACHVEAFQSTILDWRNAMGRQRL